MKFSVKSIFAILRPVQLKHSSYVSEAVPFPIDTFAAIYVAAEAMGAMGFIRTPRAGILQAATLYDVDDEGTQVDVYLSSEPFVAAADNAAFSITAFSATNRDALNQITTLEFTTFKDNINGQFSEQANIGIPFKAPHGGMYFQGITRATPTIAAEKAPRFKVRILPDDPNDMPS